MASKKVTRELSIFVNDREVVNSLGGISREIGKVSGQMRNLNKNSESYDQDLKQLKNTLGGLKDKQSEFKEEIYDTNQAADIAKDKLSNIFVGLRSGNLAMVKDGLSGIRGSIVSVTKAGLAFIATPIGAAIAVLTTAFVAGKAIFEYNSGLREMNEELRALGVSSEEMSKVRSEVHATAETFDKEFSEIAKKAKGLSETYGISMTEANDVIAQGLADGGAKNEEFLDSLGEYDEFFSKMGYSAKETADIINQGYELGIYTDKLPDALKEADLALREQSKSSRDALVNAFGASFTDDILKRVNSGAITTKKALEEIAEKSKTANLSQQQQAQLTADVFKGAGEDAGGALKILTAVGKAATRELDATAKAQLKLTEANERLNKAQAKLFEVEGFGDMWTQIQTVAVEAFSSMLEYMADVKKDIQPLIDLVAVVFVAAWHHLKFVFTNVFDIISGLVKAMIAPWKGFAKAFKKLMKGDVQGAFESFVEGIKNAYKHIGNIFIDLYNNAVDFVKNMLDVASPVLDALGFKVDALKKSLDGIKSKKFEISGTIKTDNETTNTTTPDKDPNKPTPTGLSQAEKDAAAARKKLREKEVEEAKAAALAVAKAKQELARQQLESYIADNQTRVEKGQELTQQLLNEETVRLSSIRDKKIAFNNEEKERALIDAEEKALSDEEASLLKEAVLLDYKTREQEIELEFQRTTDELKKEYEEEQRVLKEEEDALKEADLLLKQEQQALDQDLAIAEETNKFKADGLRQNKAYKSELLGYKKLLTDKKITQNEYDRFVAVATKKNDELKAQSQMQQTQSTLSGLSQVATALGDAFGQSKEMAIVQANISGAQSILSIWAGQISGNPVIDTAIKVALTAATAVSTGKKINEIRKQKKPKQPKFFKGGFTGSASALGTDEYGPVTGVVHKNEYVIPEVMTQDPAYADTIGWLEANRQQTVKGFVDGGATTPGAIPSTGTTTPSDDSTAMLMAINTLNGILGKGITAKLLLGYPEITAINEMNDEINESATNGKINQ